VETIGQQFTHDHHGGQSRMSDCENLTRSGDCLTRNSRHLCDYCDSLLSDDERDSRKIDLYVQDWKRKAAKQPASKCLKIRKSGNDDRTCREKGLNALCPYCVAAMSDRQLRAYATALVKRNREMREYWDDRAESDEYTDELKASGVAGIDWNIECSFDNDTDYTSRTAILFFLFAFGKPCWDHSREGWIKQESVKRSRKLRRAA
jgi:hypothetical protein